MTSAFIASLQAKQDKKIKANGEAPVPSKDTDDVPLPGKQYDLGGVAQGKSWKDSEVPADTLVPKRDAIKGDIICRAGTSKAGKDAVELVFPDKVSTTLFKQLRANLFGYSPKDKCFRASLEEQQVRFAKSLATIDELGPWLPEELEAAEETEVDDVAPVTDTLAEYKEALEFLSMRWERDVTDCMMRAVALAAENEGM